MKWLCFQKRRLLPFSLAVFSFCLCTVRINSLDCAVFPFLLLILFTGQLWKDEVSSEAHQSRFQINYKSLALQHLKQSYTVLHGQHGNKMMIQSECTFWHFLSLTLIPGRQGLIQTERYSFHREYSQLCFLLVTAIFGVFSESGVISHTLPHVLTSFL